LIASFPLRAPAAARFGAFNGRADGRQANKERRSPVLQRLKALVAAFQRWQDPAWKRATLSLR
jgi:hypothetical protein